MPGTSLLDPCPTRRFLGRLGHGLSFFPPGVAGVLVGHPFDTVKVSLIAVLSSGHGGGADIGGRLAGSGRWDTPFW